MLQVPFGFIFEEHFAEENFTLSSANQEAYTWVKRWPEWSTNTLLLYGSKGSGKTHLAHIWAANAKVKFLKPTEISIAQLAIFFENYLCFILENLENYIDEASLFHMLNYITERKGYLLLTAKNPAAQLKFTLPDLMSRLKAFPSAKLNEPDDVLILALLQKLFSDIQLRISKESLDYLLPRIERSYAGVRKIVKAVDIHTLEYKREITVPLLREVLTHIDND